MRHTDFPLYCPVLETGLFLLPRNFSRREARLKIQCGSYAGEAQLFRRLSACTAGDDEQQHLRATFQASRREARLKIQCGSYAGEAQLF
jgi:hypothetical protein